MSYYLTPSKPIQKRSSRSQAQEKPSDWICVVCNNLNFSFRKTCNRCKTQTRIQNQNQLASAFSEYYFHTQNCLTAAKQPLADITNCNTPQPIERKHSQQQTQQSIFKDVHIRAVAKVLPFELAYNILDKECWESIHAEQKLQGDTVEKREEEESSGCEFTDVELQFLVSKILDENQ